METSLRIQVPARLQTLEERTSDRYLRSGFHGRPNLGKHSYQYVFTCRPHSRCCSKWPVPHYCGKKKKKVWTGAGAVCLPWNPPGDYCRPGSEIEVAVHALNDTAYDLLEQEPLIDTSHMVYTHWQNPPPILPINMIGLVPPDPDFDALLRSFRLQRPTKRLPAEILLPIHDHLPPEGQISLSLSSYNLYHQPAARYHEIGVLFSQDVRIHGVYTSTLADSWARFGKGLFWMEAAMRLRNYCWVERLGAEYTVYLHSVPESRA
ncbi:hypothetical protein MMC28_009687 [Mycoblastus sanguinarius]|nr:hypothetical protein [Mycoblastus sanguinarius]